MTSEIMNGECMYALDIRKSKDNILGILFCSAKDKWVSVADNKCLEYCTYQKKYEQEENQT